MLITFLRRAMPVALVLWFIDFVAKEWGIFGVLYICLGAGAILGLITPVRAGASPLHAFVLAKFGLLPGFLAWLIIAPVLGLLGYDSETTRKEREAALFAVTDRRAEKVG
jgi:hypothetical protein